MGKYRAHDAVGVDAAQLAVLRIEHVEHAIGPQVTTIGKTQLQICRGRGPIAIVSGDVCSRVSVDASVWSDLVNRRTSLVNDIDVPRRIAEGVVRTREVHVGRKTALEAV